MKQKENNPMYDAWRKQRKDWGDIKPITKIIPNKKRKKLIAPKYKKYEDNI